LLVVVVLPPLPVPLQIICWTRELWNSPLFITARERWKKEGRERDESSCCNKCLSLFLARLSPLALSLCVEISGQS